VVELGRPQGTIMVGQSEGEEYGKVIGMAGGEGLGGVIQLVGDGNSGRRMRFFAKGWRVAVLSESCFGGVVLLKVLMSAGWVFSTVICH